MSVKYIPGVPPVVQRPPGKVEVTLMLSEDAFLVLHKLLGQSHGILSEYYWDGTELANSLDRDWTRRNDLFDEHVSKWG